MLYMDTQRLQNLVKYRRYTVMDREWRLVNGTELYRMMEDPGQTTNLVDAYPEVAARLAAGYDKWWQSFVDEGVNERYAYIRAGTPYENPVRICSHDMLTGDLGFAWHQHGVAEATQATGIWKVEIVNGGEYTIGLRRFPRESGLAINAEFAAAAQPARLESAMPASNNVGFKEAILSIAHVHETLEIGEGDEEVTFHMKLPEGKYDLEARLLDAAGRMYPAYFVYIEKL
jgi:hypothetical protein